MAAVLKKFRWALSARDLEKAETGVNNVSCSNWKCDVAVRVLVGCTAQFTMTRNSAVARTIGNQSKIQIRR
jgi:hypothetical protein